MDREYVEHMHTKTVIYCEIKTGQRKGDFHYFAWAPTDAEAARSWEENISRLKKRRKS